MYIKKQKHNGVLKIAPPYLHPKGQEPLNGIHFQFLHFKYFTETQNKNFGKRSYVIGQCMMGEKYISELKLMNLSDINFNSL